MLRLALTLIFSLYLCGCSTIGKSKTITTDEGVVFITNIKPLSGRERVIAKKSLLLISKIDQNQVYPYFPESLYWAKLGDKYAGLTVTFGSDPKTQYKHVYIDRETVLLNERDPLEWLHFGCLLSHELNHYFHDTEDPHTGRITNEVIYRKLAEDPTLLRNFEKWWSDVIKSR